jgi:hypothetical protein
MMDMNIYEALDKVKNWRKREYFKWKFNLRYDQRLPKKSVEDFLKQVELKTLNPFLEWEKTEEYRNLLAIYLSTRFDHDLAEIYSNLAEKAKQGDEKSIKLLLQMGKDIKGFAKEALKEIHKEDDGEDLIL